MSSQFSQSLMQMEKNIAGGNFEMILQDLELLKEPLVSDQYQEMFGNLKTLITGVLKLNDYA